MGKIFTIIVFGTEGCDKCLFITKLCGDRLRVRQITPITNYIKEIKIERDDDLLIFITIETASVNYLPYFPRSLSIDIARNTIDRIFVLANGTSDINVARGYVLKRKLLREHDVHSIGVALFADRKSCRTVSKFADYSISLKTGFGIDRVWSLFGRSDPAPLSAFAWHTVNKMSNGDPRSVFGKEYSPLFNRYE